MAPNLHLHQLIHKDSLRKELSHKQVCHHKAANKCHQAHILQGIHHKVTHIHLKVILATHRNKDILRNRDTRHTELIRHLRLDMVTLHSQVLHNQLLPLSLHLHKLKLHKLLLPLIQRLLRYFVRHVASYIQGNTRSSIVHCSANLSRDPTSRNPSIVRHRLSATYSIEGIEKKRSRKSTCTLSKVSD